MKMPKSLEEFLETHTAYEQELDFLRNLLNSMELVETFKWAFPVFTVEGKNVVGIGAFKSYCGIWFFQGALLKDAQQKLMNAQEGKTEAMRQWRFQNLQELQENEVLIREYVAEAILNQQQGREIKPKKKPLVIPDELQNLLNDNAELKGRFEALTFGRRREFADYVGEAKREETRLKRLEKVVPIILEGRGLNDKYRK